MAQLYGRAPATIAADMIEESMRMREVPGIYFVDRQRGRSAAIMGVGLQVWQMCDLIQAYDGELERILIDYPNWTRRMLEAALKYRSLYPDEIEALQHNNELLAERIAAGNYPGISVVRVKNEQSAKKSR